MFLVIPIAIAAEVAVDVKRYNAELKKKVDSTAGRRYNCAYLISKVG